MCKVSPVAESARLLAGASSRAKRMFARVRFRQETGSSKITGSHIGRSRLVIDLEGVAKKIRSKRDRETHALVMADVSVSVP